MRRFHGLLLAAWLPGAAFAQDGGAVIRVEAKRGPNATAEAVAGWQAQFDDVVTFRLPGGWTAIALGPQDPAEAAARLRQLKAEGKIPADSFVTEPEVELVPATSPAATPADNPPATPVAAADVAPAPGGVAVPAMDMDLNPLGAAPAAVKAPDRHLRLESFQSRAEADAGLQKWRATFPDAGMWQLPDDRFAIGLGPLSEATGAAWLAAFKSAGAAPKESVLATTAEMGAPVVPGARPDLPAPPAAPAALPPLDQVQRALRWAGHYAGKIDGKGGPMTDAAIQAEILAERLSSDPGTAMQRLIERRAAWRDSMGLSTLNDAHTGLSAVVPMDKLVFDRNERALSIYGPKDGSGAALILFSQPGGQQDLLDISGLVIALGWVPKPLRDVQPGAITLHGRNDTHIGHAEGFVRDGRAEGFVLIWPATDAENQQRVAAELSDSFARSGPAANDAPAEAPVDAPADAALPVEAEAPAGN